MKHIVFFFLMLCAVNNNAQYLVKDPAFGPNEVGGHRGMAAVQNGKIVCIKLLYISNEYHFALTQLNSDGTQDFSFGTNGEVIFPNPGLSTWGQGSNNAVAIQDDGKILVACMTGQTVNGEADYEIAVRRFNANGSPDDSFGVNGVASTNYNWGRANGECVAVQQDGRILVIGNMPLNNGDLVVVRFNSNGMVDTTFGTGGYSLINFAANGQMSSDLAHDIALSSNGNILLLGYTNFDATFSGINIGVAQLTSNGSIDTGFGDGGAYIFDLGQAESSRTMFFGDQGAFYCTGYKNSGAWQPLKNGILIKFNQDGSLDQNFGADGVFTLNIEGDTTFSDGMLLPSGQIFIAGTWNDYAMFCRLNPNGTLDTTFDDDGIKIFPDLYGANFLVGHDGGFVSPTATWATGSSISKFILDDDGLSVTEQFRKKAVMWPNPFTNRISINKRCDNPLQIELIDVSGRTVNGNLPFTCKDDQIDISLSDISDGIYYIRLSENGDSETFQIVKSP